MTKSVQLNQETPACAAGEISTKEASELVRSIIKSKLEEAEAAAKVIYDVMENDFFTIEEMRKKMVIRKNGAHPNLAQKMSWNDAKVSILNLQPFGLVEIHPSEKDTYKIRLDVEFRISFFENIKDIFKTKISDANVSLALIKERIKKKTTKKRDIREND